jgi:serine/threonine-protein kinase RsbW
MSRDVRDSLALLLSEMVNNAVQHGGADEDERIQVRLSWPSQRLRVEVVDPGTNRRESIERVTREGGWGLVLVDSIADRWGLESVPEGGSVAWFELAVGGRYN